MTDLEVLMINATRYCLGRRSYAVGEQCDILKRHWNELTTGTRLVIIHDVEEALASENPPGMDQDVREWEHLAKALWR